MEKTVYKAPQVTTRTRPAVAIDRPAQRTVTTTNPGVSPNTVLPGIQVTYRQPMRAVPAHTSLVKNIEAQRNVVTTTKAALSQQQNILSRLKTDYTHTKVTTQKEALAQKIANQQDRVDKLEHAFNTALDVYTSILTTAKHDCHDIPSWISLIHTLSSQREGIKDIPELVAIHDQVIAAICDQITQNIKTLAQSNDLIKICDHIRMLLKTRNELKDQCYNQESLNICTSSLKTLSESLGNRLKHIFNNQPNFLKDGTFWRFFGFNKKEELWHSIARGSRLFHEIIEELATHEIDFTTEERHYTPADKISAQSALKKLYEVQLLLKETLKNLEHLARTWSYHTSKNEEHEYKPIHQAIEDELKEIDWFIGFLKECGGYSAAQFTLTLYTPKFLSSKLAVEWNTYEPLREFIVDHYQENMSVDTILEACANAHICRIVQPEEYPSQNLIEAHNCLMEKFVNLCQLQAKIKIQGDWGIDVDYADEYSRATRELDAIGLCVAKMLAELNPHSVYDNGFISFGMVLEEQAREKQLAAKDREILTQILEFYVQALIQKYACIGISTDSEGAVRGFVGPFGFDLVKPRKAEDVHLDLQRRALGTQKKKTEDKVQAATTSQTDSNPVIDLNKKRLSFLIARCEAFKRQQDAITQPVAGAPSVTTQLSRNSEEFIRLVDTNPQDLARLEATNPEKFGKLLAAVSADALTLSTHPDSADLVRLSNAAWHYRREKFKTLREQCNVLTQGQYNPLLMLDALETSTGLVLFDEQSRLEGDPKAQLRNSIVLKMLNQTPLQEFLHAQPAREYTLPPITPDSSFEDLLARQNYLQASGIMDRLDAETAESCTRLLIHDGPHVIKGAAKGAVKAFNPVNLAHGACVMAKQTSAAAGFILLQAARLETAQELAATQPEQAQVILEQYNAANAAVVEGAIQIGHEFAAHMSTMSREERIEFIAETLAEVALTKSSTKFWLAATGKALNAAGKGVRKIAQVVEEVNPAKPKAIAATPEGIMLDAAEVLETEANPIAKVAKLQEGPAVEGRAAAQGVQAAEDAPKVTEPGQVHEVPAIECKPVIKGYTETAINRDHVFSDNHKKAGLMKLSKLGDTPQGESEIIGMFQDIIKEVDSHGLLKTDRTNIIRTIINGHKVDIKIDIRVDGLIRSFDGYIGWTGRDTFHIVRWNC
jgi:hypothetical protein